MERKPCWGPSEPQREGRKHREANFQDEVNPCFYHPDLAEPSLESSGKQKCGSQSSGPSNKAEFRHGREQPKNWYTVLDLSSRGGSGVGKMGERLNQYFFFFADSSRLTCVMINH